jgi:hypothetical protein
MEIGTAVGNDWKLRYGRRQADWCRGHDSGRPWASPEVDVGEEGWKDGQRLSLAGSLGWVVILDLSCLFDGRQDLSGSDAR